MTADYERVLTKLRTYPGDEVPLRWFSLGWRVTEELRDSFAVGALTTGALQARGQYHTWVCDDERMAYVHIEKLMDLIEDGDLDFAYPLVHVWESERPREGRQIGVWPPAFGHVTSVVYNRRVLDKGMYRFHMPRATNDQALVPHDWDIISRWVKAGARSKMLPLETFSHRVDH